MEHPYPWAHVPQCSESPRNYCPSSICIHSSRKLLPLSRLYYCRERAASPCAGQMKLLTKRQRGWLSPLHSQRKEGSWVWGGREAQDQNLFQVSPAGLHSAVKCPHCWRLGCDSAFVGSGWVGAMRATCRSTRFFFIRVTCDKSSLLFWISFSVNCDQRVNLGKTLLTCVYQGL